MSACRKTEPKKKSKLDWNDREARAALARYERSVRGAAKRLSGAARATHALEYEDLLAEGRVAVLEALRTYKGTGDYSEQRWVWYRVWQRMIDAIRRVSRYTRDEVRTAQQEGWHACEETTDDARAILARKHGHYDSTAEITVHEDQSQESGMFETERLVDELNRARRLRLALTRVPVREKQVCEMAIDQGMTQVEIAKKMNVSGSRICQLQKRAVKMLKDHLRELDEAA